MYEILFKIKESKIEILHNFIFVIDNVVELLKDNKTQESIKKLELTKTQYVKMILEELKI